MNNLAFELIENYKKIPNKVVLVQGERNVTYADLYKKVASFKRYLLERNIGRGQKVLVLVPMTIELYITLLSLWSIGAIPCFMDAGFIRSGMKKNEFNDISAIIGIKKYILYSNVNRNLKKLKNKIDVGVLKGLDEEKVLEIEEVEKDFSGILTYTSGTTGKPKIASRSHEFLKCQGDILLNNLNYDENDVEMSSVPIFTLSNIYAGIITVIADGNFTNLGKSNPVKLINQIYKNNVNRIMASPGLLQRILNYADKNNIKFEKVNKVFTGGGAVFIDFINALKRVFTNAKIVTLYGSTEAEPIAECDVTDMSKEDFMRTASGFGILAGNIVGVKKCELIKTNRKEIGSITENEFKEMKVRENGEIVVTGDNVLKGYVNGIGDLENKFYVGNEVFHRTGDLGSFDELGRLWLKGRINEPFFNIEAALHAKFNNLGKTAVLKANDKVILVVEKKSCIDIEKVNREIDFENIDEVVCVRKIPVDKRHSSKVDYKELRKVLKR